MTAESTRKIGRYEIRREIGRGGMGIVYLAYDPVVCRDVALKTISLPRGLSEEERRDYNRRFLREARTAGALVHPGIVTIFDCDVDGESGTFISMEYVAGRSLKQQIDEDGAGRPEQVFVMAEGIADALHAAHMAGVIHRDIKPANILIRASDGATKIVDFGIAQLPVSDLTLDQTTPGSPAYMAPERMNGHRADSRSDLFSLAVILYESLCGRRPFQGEDAKATMAAVLNLEPEPLTSRLPAMPAGIDAFFQRALAKSPEERFADGWSFRDAVVRLRGEYDALNQGITTVRMATDDLPSVGSGVPSEEEATGSMPLTGGTRRTWLLAAMLGLAILLAFASGWLSRGGTTLPAEPLLNGGTAAAVGSLSVAAPATDLDTADDGTQDSPTSPAAGEKAPADPAPFLDTAPHPPRAGSPPVVESRAEAALAEPADETEVETPDPPPMRTERSEEIGRPAVAGDPVPSEATPVERDMKTAEASVAEPAPVEEPAPRQVHLPAPDLAAPAEPPVAVVEAGYLDVEIRSSIREGTLVLTLDGETVLTEELAADGGRFKRLLRTGKGAVQHVASRLEVPIGEHTLRARVDRTDKDDYEDSLRLELTTGETLTLTIRIGRTMGFGSPLSLKLDDESGSDQANSNDN